MQKLNNLFVSETFSNLRLKVANYISDRKLQNFFVSGLGVTGFGFKLLLIKSKNGTKFFNFFQFLFYYPIISLLCWPVGKFKLSFAWWHIFVNWRSWIFRYKGWSYASHTCLTCSVTRLGNLLDFGQVLKAFGNNSFAQISHIVRQFL